MKSTLVQALLAYLLVLPTGCKKESSADAGSGQGLGNATQASGPGTVTTAPSAQEQMALKDAQTFLDGGGNVNARDSLGTTRLMDAALNDYGAVVMLLASKGADVNAVDDTLGQAALHFCAIGDNPRAAAALIERGANVDARDRRGKTPLHEAAAAGSVNLIKILLNKKADVKARDGRGRTPIDCAAQAQQKEAVALLLAAGSDPARKPPAPPPVISKSSSLETKDKATVPPPAVPPQSVAISSKMVNKVPVGSFAAPGAKGLVSPSATNSTPGAEAAAIDLADMVLWWGSQPWVIALEKSMPRGVTVSMHAEPYNGGGWSDVELREHHAPNSGFDPDVSPLVGLFRVSRAGRKVEWMEPVSGEYEPLEGFLKSRGLKVAESTTTLPKTIAVAGGLSVAGGDFETNPPATTNRDTPAIVKDPTDPKNHVARITGPDEMGFTLPITVPSGTEELTITLRLLHPESTKLIRFEDGRMPEGIRLRVRLLNDRGNSAIRDAVVRPTGQWRDMEFTFYEQLKNVVQVRVEAIWMQGPIYVDDVRIAKP